ncbi:MAG: N-formylglutamate deformylase [bacterium]
MTAPLNVKTGQSPLILTIPHSGTYIPSALFDFFNEIGQSLTDTDWFVDELYSDILPDITIIKANFHRYVIDANRPPDDHNLYPGKNSTSLCPLTDFNGNALYKTGMEPGPQHRANRLDEFHKPYHDAIATQLSRLKARYEHVLLYDCHSIRSELPFLFSGKLPDLNIGTADGHSCDQRLVDSLIHQCTQHHQFSHILNGRFKGGWTTRHYGQPSQNIHAIQMELAQSTYMKETAPAHYDPAMATPLRAVLRDILQSLLATLKQLNSE